MSFSNDGIHFDLGEFMLCGLNIVTSFKFLAGQTSGVVVFT